MRLVTNQEMKEIDTWAQNFLGIPGIVLMENAGRGCVEVLKRYFKLNDLNVLIICGPGNNGGDGMVIARHLKNQGSNVSVLLLCRAEQLKGDALLNYTILKKSKIKVLEVNSVLKLTEVFASFPADCIVDAIFGTGFKGKPAGIYKKAIELINHSEKFVLSVDIPSGINGDTGDFEEICVVADATVTMCLPKRGIYLFPGRASCGSVYVVDIGVPLDLINHGYPWVIEYEDIFNLLPYRPPDGNKGTFGQVLIIAGARGFSGAAAMGAIAALKVGAGLVRLAAPNSIINPLEAKLLEVVKIPLPETESGTISPEAIKTILPLMEKSDVIAVGPGITTNEKTVEFVFKLLPMIKKPLVIDADGINIIARDISILKKIKAPFILTPHPGELSRITGLSPSNINKDRLGIAARFVREWGGILILKGAPTIISSATGEVFLNPTGNSGLASAGSGDVLFGMLAGFLAQNLSPINAAVCAVFLHGLCAELAMNEDNNEYSLTAGDLLEIIPKSINFILNRKYE
ncbi:MAG: NAD(P)H-hydrate dehydratase [candidate division WOR-3 bacterium]